MTGKRRRLIECASASCGLLLLGGTAAYLAWPRERLLTEIARPVLDVDSQSMNWNWITDDKLVLTKTGTEFDVMREIPWRGHVELLTLRAATAPVSRPLFLDKGGIVLSDPTDFRQSPSGGWLTWINHETGDGWPFPASARSDGTRARSWNRDKSEVDYFLDDSHWVEETNYDPYDVIVRDLADPKRDHRYPFESVQARAIRAVRAARRPTFVDARLSHITYNVGVASYRSRDEIRLMCSHMKDPTPLWSYNPKLPAGSDLITFRVSPTQPTVVYHLRTVKQDPIAVLARGLGLPVRVEVTTTESLWISCGAGHLHEVGHVPRTTSLEGGKSLGTDEIAGLEWLPGGDRISFACRGKLYVMPVKPTH